MRQIWIIARREIKSLFDQPSGYVLLAAFLVLNAFLFFRNAYFTNSASLRPMIDLMPWIFLFLVPAVSMRALAEDNRSGILEVVLSQPISEVDLVLGKFFGVVLTVWGALATTILIPIGLSLGSSLQWGPVVGQYVGAMMLVIGFAGIGVWASSVSRSQITAFILSVGVMFLLMLIGFDPLLVGLPPTLSAIAARLGVISHFQNIGRGVLDLRDILYFISLAAIFLGLAYSAILRRRLTSHGEGAKRLRLGTLLLTGVLVVLSLAGNQIGGRIDLTPGGAYTLAPTTRTIVGEMKDIVNITLFSSGELPQEMLLRKRDVTDLLSDLRSASGGKIRILERNPDADPDAMTEVKRVGILPMRFNTTTKNALEIKQGFFGMIIQHGDKEMVFTYLQQGDNLEYRVISAIRTMSLGRPRRVAVVLDPEAGAGFKAVLGELARSYDVVRVVLADSTVTLKGFDATIVIANRDSVPEYEMSKLSNYLDAGGRLMVFESGMTIPEQGSISTARPVGFNPLLKKFGVAINGDFVYDMKANLPLNLQTSTGGVVSQPFPLFLRAQSAQNSPINSEINELFLGLSSSIDTLRSRSGILTPLLLTTDGGGVIPGQASLEIQQNFPRTGLKRQLLAASVMSNDSLGARLVVVGNSQMLNDEYTSRSPANVIFALNAVDWLTADEALISIRAKNRQLPTLTFSNDSVKNMVKYANVILLPVIIGLIGFARMVARRRKSQAPYQRPSATAA